MRKSRFFELIDGSPTGSENPSVQLSNAPFISPPYVCSPSSCSRWLMVLTYFAPLTRLLSPAAPPQRDGKGSRMDMNIPRTNLKFVACVTLSVTLSLGSLVAQSCGYPIIENPSLPPGAALKGGGNIYGGSGGKEYGGGCIQDGGICPPHGDYPDPAGGNFVPPPPGTLYYSSSGNTSLIGAMPFDLGAQVTMAGPPVGFFYDHGQSYVGMALQSTPYGHRHGYGASFALGHSGTVSPATGAFVHPFTLLALPGYADNMGIRLRATYLSNASEAGEALRPFGARFVLSGYDLLEETSGQSAGAAGAAEITVHRGDGFTTVYTLVQPGGNTYASLGGVQDQVAFSNGDYRRLLPDGRIITYTPAGGQDPALPMCFVRRSVEDRYNNTISYSYDDNGTYPRELKSIVDTRQVKIELTWSDVTGIGRRITRIHLPYGPGTDLANMTPAVSNANELAVDLAYDVSTGMPNRITYFERLVSPTADATPGAARPAVSISYDPQGLMTKITDDTFGGTPVVRLENRYADNAEFGRVVVEQAEGSLTDSSAPKHDYTLYEAGTTSNPLGKRVYVDPLGTIVTMMLQENVLAIESVTMESVQNPRDLDTDSPIPDPITLTWTVDYNSCACTLPHKITSPEGRVYTYNWYPDRGLLANLIVQKGTEQTYTVFEYLDVVDSSVLTKIYQDVGGQAELVTEITYSRDPMAVPDFEQVEIKSLGPAVIRQLLDYDSIGRISRVTDPEGTVTDYAYRSDTEVGRRLLKTVNTNVPGAQPPVEEKLTYLFDDFARLLQTDGEDGRIHNLTWNTSQQLQAVESLPMRNEFRYDQRGNIVLSRSRNADETGALRLREWIEQKHGFDGLDRVVSQKVDQAPLNVLPSDFLESTYTYQADHRLLTESLPTGAQNLYVWDGHKRFYKKVCDDGGISFTPTRQFFDKDGLLIVAKNGVGDETTIGLSPIGLIQTVTNDEHGQVLVERDSLLRIKAVIAQDISGTSPVPLTRTDFDYNAVTGWLEKTKRQLDPTTSTGIDDQVLWVRNKRGQLIEKGFEATPTDTSFGRGFKVIYDALGRVQQVEDKHGGQTNKVVYDYEPGTGRLKSKTSKEARENAAGSSPLWEERIYSEDYVYDSLDRLLSVKRNGDAATQSGAPASIQHNFLYDSLSHRVQFTDSMNAKLRWERDGLGREVAKEEIGHAGQITIRTTCDYTTSPTDWSTVKTDATGFTTKLVYDRVGRITRKENPGYNAGNGAQGVSFFYDAASRLLRTEDGRGAHVLHEYDGASRLTKRELDPSLPHPATVSQLAVREIFNYDAIGRRTDYTTEFKDGSTDWPLVRVDDLWDPLGRSPQSDFTFFFAPLYVGNTTLGVTSEWTNDLHYRTGLQTSGAAAGNAFDIQVTPDALGRMKSSSLSVSGTSSTLASYRFVGGRVLARDAHSAGGAVQSTANIWDGQKRLFQTGTSIGAASVDYAYTYNDEGRIEQKLYDKVGVTLTGGNTHEGDAFDLDGVHRLTDSKLGFQDNQIGGSFASLTQFQVQRDYEYDLGQSRNQVIETPGGGASSTEVYTKQPNSSRYATVGPSGNATALLYDEAGNCIYDGNFVYKYDFRHRLSEVYQQVEGETQGATAGGSTPSGRTTIVWPELDAEKIARFHCNFACEHQVGDYLKSGTGSREPLRATTEEPSGAVAGGGEGEATFEMVAYYGYDANNRRVVRMLNDGGLKTYCSSFDGWREFEESELGIGQNNAAVWQKLQVFIWGNGLDELLRFAKFNGTGWDEYTTLQDERSNVVRLINASGQVHERYEYDPYGEVTTFDATDEEMPFTQMPYLYTGRRFDPETGLYYFRNRFYSTELGRFMSKDPLGQWADPFSAGNPYAFTGNAPGDLMDPLGLQVKFGIKDPALEDRATARALERFLADKESGKQDVDLAEYIQQAIAESYEALYGKGSEPAIDLIQKVDSETWYLCADISGGLTIAIPGVGVLSRLGAFAAGLRGAAAGQQALMGYLYGAAATVIESAHTAGLLAAYVVAKSGPTGVAAWKAVAGLAQAGDRIFQGAVLKYQQLGVEVTTNAVNGYLGGNPPGRSTSIAGSAAFWAGAFAGGSGLF